MRGGGGVSYCEQQVCSLAQYPSILCGVLNDGFSVRKRFLLRFKMYFCDVIQ